VQRWNLGNSVQGRPIEGVRVDAAPLHTLFIGAFHGDEGISTQLLNAWLETQPLTSGVAVIPALNPDGLAANTRANARGVDLNRNWPTQNWEPSEAPYYGGPQPASEPETRLLMALIEANPIHTIVTVHSPYKVVNWDGPAEALAQAMSAANGYPAVASIGYPTPGSFGTWAGIERGIAVITLELPEDEPLDQVCQDNFPALAVALPTASIRAV
jgi:protein MpaA